MFHRRSTMAVEPSPESVRHARRFFAQVAARAHLEPEEVRRGELAVSELVTNAIEHTHGPIELHARIAKTGLRIEVADREPSAPHMGVADVDDVGSRGLPIVAALAAEWGWDSEPDEPGKRVWFTLRPDHAR